MQTLEDMGNAVKIRTLYITMIVPAVNIQVEDIPDGYDVYFEVMFEDGGLWEINNELGSNRIFVYEWFDWPKNHRCLPDCVWACPDWETFLMMYITKASTRSGRSTTFRS